MASKRQRRKVDSTPKLQPVSPTSAKRGRLIFSLIAAFFLGVGISALALVRKQPPETELATNVEKTLATLGELSMMDSDDLNTQDIALLNLRCAEGLPGSEDLDIVDSLRTLDRWADKVRQETDRMMVDFYAQPDKYENSIAYYRMLMLVTVLQQDFGVKYNPDRIEKIDFTVTVHQDQLGLGG